MIPALQLAVAGDQSDRRPTSRPFEFEEVLRIYKSGGKLVKWFTDQEKQLLLEAGLAHLDDDDLVPLVSLFQPDGPGVWLVAELDANDPDLAYGLGDMGQGAPEIGTFSLTELAEVRGRLGLAIERDRSFRPKRSLADYARIAAAAGRIVR